MRTSALTLAVIASAACACSVAFPARVPMQSRSYGAHGEKPARCLVVLLPGMGDHDVAYEKNGFIAAARQRPLSLDLIAADATYGYYARRTVIDRLQEDVVGPARAKGYEQVWLVGISMGGIGTLLFTTQQRDKIDGILLLAPYLGSPEMIDEIDAWGTLARWSPGKPVARDYQREIWRWLQAVTSGRKQGPRLYLGAGKQDSLRRGHRLLAAALPKDHVKLTEGGHDWPPWTRLWEDFLDGPALRNCLREVAAAPGVRREP